MQRMFCFSRTKQIGHSEIASVHNETDHKFQNQDQAPAAPAPASPLSTAWVSITSDNFPESPLSPASLPANRVASHSLSSIRLAPSKCKVDAQLDPKPAYSPSASLEPILSRRHTGGITGRLKHLVSKEKRRFSSDGFDLDLTYVTQRLVALGYPAENIEGIYRNHYRDVFRFFEQRHPGRYRVYNLCAERRYAPDEKFHGRVAEFGFEDHSPPPLSMLLPFCRDIHSWLTSNPENIVAVHCKAGKGRTGVMLCAYMLYARMWRSAHGALEFFAAARSKKLQGVTILSQRRFVGYFSDLCRQSESVGDLEVLESYDNEEVREQTLTLTDYHMHWLQEAQGQLEDTMPRDNKSLPHAKPVLPARVNLVLAAVVLCGITGHKKTNSSADSWRIRLECGAIRPRSAVYELPGSFQRQQRPIGDGDNGENVVELELKCDRVLIWDEVKVELRRRTGGVLGYFWFHTAFVSCANDRAELTLKKSEIDKVAKDGQCHKKFAPDFAIRLCFELATKKDMAKATLA